MKKIAVWSGPRNISTAMMRSFENRPDCCVIDEPFYGCYLTETDLKHPMYKEIIESMPCEREAVVRSLTENSKNYDVFYQKHMTHHMPLNCDLNWCRSLHHVFLIREPARVIASYLNKMPSVTEDDIGIVRQHQLFEEMKVITGKTPLVVNSAEVLKSPRDILNKLCAALRIPFYDEMLSWPAGRRSSDGIWSSHWYHSVDASTGFQGYNHSEIDLPSSASMLAKAMEDYYLAMKEHQL